MVDREYYDADADGKEEEEEECLMRTPAVEAGVRASDAVADAEGGSVAWSGRRS